MAREFSLAETANIPKLLGDKTRLSMINLLFDQDCCACEFVEIFNCLLASNYVK